MNVIVASISTGYGPRPLQLKKLVYKPSRVKSLRLFIQPTPSVLASLVKTVVALVIYLLKTMSTVTTSSLSDTLPSTIPKLEAEGENWGIFYVRFMDAVEAKGFWGHFDGSSPEPILSSKPTEEETKARNQWAKDERSAKTLLTQRLPDSTVMEIHWKKWFRNVGRRW